MFILLGDTKSSLKLFEHLVNSSEFLRNITHVLHELLPNMVPEEDHEPMLMEEGEVVDDFEESQETEVDKLTAARAIEVITRPPDTY